MSYNTAFQYVPDAFQGDAFQIALVLPPVNVVPPIISGTAQVGQTLSATEGIWINFPTSYTYQWQQDGTINIGAATTSTYQITQSDVGHTLNVVVTASNSAGFGTASSAPTAIVIPISTQPVATGGGGDLKGAEYREFKPDLESWQKIKPPDRTRVLVLDAVGSSAGLGHVRFRSGISPKRTPRPKPIQIPGWLRPAGVTPTTHVGAYTPKVIPRQLFYPSAATPHLGVGSSRFTSLPSGKDVLALMKQVGELKEALADVLELVVPQDGDLSLLESRNLALGRLRNRLHRQRMDAEEERILLECDDWDEMTQQLMELYQK